MLSYQSVRRLLFPVLALLLVSPLRAASEPEVPPAVDNARNSALCRITSDNVYIRSGPGDNYYPITKLKTGDEITVVGERFEWLKIIPPSGSFSYIAKAFVDKQPDGAGKVNRDDVNVRAGSELNAMKTTVQDKLSNGTPVQIVGEADEYYKIKPTASAFAYVSKKNVEPVKLLPAVAQDKPAAPASPAAPAAPAQPEAQAQQTQQTPQQIDGAAPATPEAQASGPTTAPSREVAGAGTAAGAPTTQPTAAANPSEQTFDKLEAEFAAASEKSIEQQPIPELLAGYRKVLADTSVPESMRRIASFRAQVLEVRAKARDEFMAVQKQQEDSKKKQQALKAEQQELAQQIKKTEVQMFTAIGTLRTSSLQQGAQMLYRLTDPATGRTVVYLRTNDPKIAQSLGQFIGVKGELAADPQLSLKVVTTTDWSAVDPNQLYRQVAAQVVPPSMVPQGQASTENQ